MRTNPPEADAEQVEPEREDLESVTSYEDDGDLVICEKQNPTAWIRAAVTSDVRP